MNEPVERYRDPVHGFIEVRPLENAIINSAPFQRLRNIKQLAMTYLVYHGAEHTRFGHSLGVMELVTRAFREAVKNGKSAYKIPENKQEWYEQILRLIALTHDIGHAPFSHASEKLFPDNMEHEDFTEKIIKETCISSYILKIGENFKKKGGEEFDITPDLICDIYRGRNPGAHSEFTFLQSFMDSELDCDKMDYLLRDSLYCGVNYGKFDLARLLTSLTIYKRDNGPRLAIKYGGLQVFEEFVLARYFMFTEVYFHRTRRYFDIMLGEALKNILPNGMYSSSVDEYLSWDDGSVLEHMRELAKRSDSVYDACRHIINRTVYPCVLSSPVHGETQGDLSTIDLLCTELYNKFDQKNFLRDDSAGKMPHKIPIKTEVDDEKAIILLDYNRNKLNKKVTISEESPIIRALTSKIDIHRVYVSPELGERVRKYIEKRNMDINGERQKRR